jgi:2-oxo-4-hydroxy-4-carboxy--5-ureidoimidazoline (OHCU) decarboxylase
MTMTDEIVLGDPDDLTEQEQALLLRLIAADAEELDQEVRRYVANPTESMQLVLRHPDLVERVNDSLNRQLGAAQQRRQHSTGRIRRLADDQVAKLGRERKAIAPYLNLALAEAARNSSRARCERILGRVMYPELKRMITDMEGGMSERQVEAATKERLAPVLAALREKYRKR